MSLNILMVDDSQTVLDVLERTIHMSGLDVASLHRASNGQEGLDVLRSTSIDLVFADINMPVMGGVEMVEHMSRDGLLKSIPVVVVSTEGSATRVQALRDKGISGFVRKPFTPESIKAVALEVLATKA